MIKIMIRSQRGYMLGKTAQISALRLLWGSGLVSISAFLLKRVGENEAFCFIL